ncbi:hypothetical protein MZM54_03095 [[Brevibacterium] frigoritolerans]|nr:hypothetical protein [Peribacillus frigoritolerans]
MAMYDELFYEQVQYLKENHRKICAQYFGQKVGMDLNLTYHFGSLAYFELKKIYSNVSNEIFYRENLTSEVFGVAMDSCLIQKGDNFSLKESMKTEAKMVLLTNYVMRLIKSGKQIFPSEILRKEKVLNNAHKRACKIIDAFFYERDILFSEVKDVFDHYEMIVTDNGRVVDFHFGTHGFSFNEQTSSLDILAFVEKERAKYQISAEYVKQNNRVFEKFQRRFVEEELLPDKKAKSLVLLDIHSYDLQTISEKGIKARVDTHKENVEILYEFLKKLKVDQVNLPEQTKFFIDNRRIKIDDFIFNYGSGSSEGYITQFKNYKAIVPLMDKVQQHLQSNELLTTLRFKSNSLQIEARMKPNLGLLRDRLNAMLELQADPMPVKRDRNNTSVSLVLPSQNGKLFRKTGEEVLTSEVILFEVMEKLRNSDKEYFLTVERAKEMLFAVLSPEEEELMREENMTIIEGKKNYYALINRSYNNVVKIPKALKHTDDIKALCIHPAEANIPMYDGFASIVLSVKSGDEDYVLDNSNEFSLQQSIKEKVYSLFKSFLPKNELSIEAASL